MSRNGSQALQLGGPHVTQPRWSTLFNHMDGKSLPRVVRVEVNGGDEPGVVDDITRAQSGSRIGAGVWWTTDQGGVPAPWIGGGALRFRFGSRLLRTIYVDLARGEYQLPPCESVAVDAAVWNPMPSVGERSLVTYVSAEVEDGSIADPSPMLVHARRIVPAGQGVIYCFAPPGAYAVDVAPDMSVPVTLSSPPHRAFRHLAAHAWDPPYSPILIGTEPYGRIRLESAAAGEWLASLVFWIR